ncbi:unnamed protein product [Pleuronectes platessa]|uniref:Uncharacterized protein n=1 Tax=Pleuronectes platessa TaxID=8262 RepID=A0A9N7VV07_PLEPL|nr:unnamed protein product [Pleuronectes platessa]
MLTTCSRIEELSAEQHRGGTVELRARLQVLGMLWGPKSVGVHIRQIDGDDLSKLLVKGSSSVSFPSSRSRCLILSLEEHPVTMDGRPAAMATAGLSLLRLPS